MHYWGYYGYLFINGKQELKFIIKADQINKEKLCLCNLSSDWTADESKKPGLYGNIYDFVIDYKLIANTDSIHDMHNYLMTKYGINHMLNS